MGEPSSSSAPPKSGSRKVKFAPSVPARRKKVEQGNAPDASLVSTPSTSRATDDAFKELIKAAQSDPQNNRSSLPLRGGRYSGGRGRGNQQPQNWQVTFGGANGSARFADHRGSSQQPRASSRPSASRDSQTAGEASLDTFQTIAKKKKERGPLLNYNQYFPTILPLRQPGTEEVEAAQEPLVPRELEISEELQELETAGAHVEGLLAEGSEQLYLFQLPALLPKSGNRQGMGSPAAVSLKDLPSGKVGKLLVFESGAMKLQLGDVLLDVSTGVPCHFRQDVAAINPSSGDCVFLGDVAERVVATPDVQQLLSDEPIPNWSKRKLVQPTGMVALLEESLHLTDIKVKAEEQL